jgi:hypothetical protein
MSLPTFPDSDIELQVDGTPTELTVVWHHNQSDPYPGGHRYSLILRHEAAEQIADQLPEASQQRLDEGITNDFFNNFNILGIGRRSNPPRWRFVLNTIESVRRSQDAVFIEGICSPFVR